MSLPLFIAKRIYRSEGDQQEVSRPAIQIATMGVAIGLAVMIITVSVVLGFKHTIRDKVVGLGSDIQVMSFTQEQTAVPVPVCISDTLMRQLRGLDNVRHVARYSLTQGVLKTNDDFLGVAFKGVDADYDYSFLRQCLEEGALPVFKDDKVGYELLISRQMANKLHLHVGDKVYAYFVAYDDVRARRFTVCGIYQSQMKQFDETLCLCDFRVPVKLNDWEADQCSGAEVMVGDFDRLNETALKVSDIISRDVDRYGETLSSQTVLEAYPQIFSWLDLLDINVWIILILMVCVAGFTMISGLLIIILERTRMIGLLKALGARNKLLRRTFLWFAIFIIGRGLLWGNAIGIGLVLLQQYTGFVSLDPASYYVSTAPVEMNVPFIVALNAVTLLVTVFILIAPSYLVSRIRPAKVLQFE